MATSSKQLYRFRIERETSHGILAAVDGSDESVVILLEVTPDPLNLEFAFKTLSDLADKFGCESFTNDSQFYFVARSEQQRDLICDEIGRAGLGWLGNNVPASKPIVSQSVTGTKPLTDRKRKSAPPPTFGSLEEKSGSRGPLFFGIGLSLIALIGVIWYFNVKPPSPPQASQAVSAPLSGQVTDLRPPQVSLLNHPTFTPSPAASWNDQNVRGIITFKTEDKVQSIVYPNGSQFTMKSDLFSFTSTPSAKLNNEYGTVVLGSTYSLTQQNMPSTWQVQFQSDQAKDINGDGFPELVLSDYSGGAHCCTTIAVISLRPQGPFVVFDEELGSGGAEFKDLDGDGRLEIRRDRLFEYALGSFAQGTFGVPVIYGAGADGVYRVNTRAFTQLISNEYDAAKQTYEKASYDTQTESMERDRDLIDLFLRAYLAGRRPEAYEELSQLKPIESDLASKPDPRDILEDALKKVAPEVLQEPEWQHIKAGVLANPAPTAQAAGAEGDRAVNLVQPDPNVRAEQAVKQLLNQWVQSFKEKNLANQVNCYAPQVGTYYLRHDVSRALIEENKARAFAAIKDIHVFDLANIRMVIDSPTQLTVTFDKTWDTTLISGKRYAGSERERLEIMVVDGEWLIQSEIEEKIYYVIH
ncbi:MAG: VCBS repeat-containing protein [Terracidiphilus sp.]